jgi:DNA-binding transcriptional ArsR family regulator
MSRNFLDMNERVEDEESLIFNLRPEFNRICYNPVRASIIHLLVNSRDLNHSLSVEDIAKKLGKRHSVIIYHLEKLKEWKLVSIVRSYKYGSKKKRSIWGLDLRYTNLIQDLYAHMTKTLYTMKDLEEMCSINRNVRME